MDLKREVNKLQLMLVAGAAAMKAAELQARSILDDAKRSGDRGQAELCARGQLNDTVAQLEQINKLFLELTDDPNATWDDILG